MRDIPMRISHAVKTGIELISPKKWDNNQQITWAELEMLTMCGMFGWFPCLKIVFVTNKIWKIWCHCSHPGFQFHPSPIRLMKTILRSLSVWNIISEHVQWRRGGVNIIHPAGSMFVPGLLVQRLFPSLQHDSSDEAALPGWLVQVMISYKNMPKLSKSMGFPRQWSTRIYFIYFPAGFSISFCQFIGG